MLDVGCGQARHTSEICHWDCRAVGVDISFDDLAVARYLISYRRWAHEIIGDADFLMAAAERLPFPDGTFDKIVCTEVLEHIPEDKGALSEMIRVLKPGGLIAVSVPAYIPEKVFWTLSWDYWHSPGGHIRYYRPGEMLAALRESGLDIYAERRRHTIQTLFWLLRCAVGKRNENSRLLVYLTKVISLYYWRRLRLLEYLEALTNPFMGKDLVFYGRKPASPGEGA